MWTQVTLDILVICYNVEFILIYNWLRLGPKSFMTTWKLFLYRLLLKRGFTVLLLLLLLF